MQKLRMEIVFRLLFLVTDWYVPKNALFQQTWPWVLLLSSIELLIVKAWEACLYNSTPLDILWKISSSISFESKRKDIDCSIQMLFPHPKSDFGMAMEPGGICHYVAWLAQGGHRAAWVQPKKGPSPRPSRWARSLSRHRHDTARGWPAKPLPAAKKQNHWGRFFLIFWPKTPSFGSYLFSVSHL